MDLVEPVLLGMDTCHRSHEESEIVEVGHSHCIVEEEVVPLKTPEGPHNLFAL